MSCAIWYTVNDNGSVSDVAIGDTIDAPELAAVGRSRQGMRRLRRDYENPDRSAWWLPAEEPDRAEEDTSTEPDEA